MKTNLDSNTKSVAVGRDTAIGSAISKAIANVSPAGLCPTAEQLAALGTTFGFKSKGGDKLSPTL